MSFANPLGLFALLAVPAILAIHLFHRRFPPLKVAGLHLWSNETRRPLSGRRPETLPISTSLILECLAATVLSIVLSQPRFGGLDAVVHLVAILDNTASMSARPPGKASYRDLAVAEIERRFQAFPRGSVITLIVTGVRPEALGHAIPWEDAREKLAAWQPTAARHSFDPAFDTALQVAGTTGQMLFLTNRPLPDGPVPATLEVVSFGEPLENLAIAAARWTYDAARKNGQLFLRIENHGVNPAAARVRGLRGQEPVFEREVSLAGKAGANFEAPLPGGLGELTVQVECPGDGLGIDSRVTLLEPHPRLVTVANLLPEMHPARESVQRVLAAIPEIQPGSGHDAHVVIGPAAPLPESSVRLWWLGVGPLSTDDADRQKARDLKGPFVLEKRHPLLDGVELAGVVWGGAQPTETGTPLVSSGSSRLLMQLPGTRTTAYLLNIDFKRSNLAESPDWPILLSNLVENRRDNLPGLPRWNYRLGEDVRFRLFEGEDGDLPEGRRELTLEFDRGSKPLARTPEVDIAAPPPAVHTIRDGDRVFDRFSVNFFDAEVSNLRTLRSFEQKPDAAAAAPQAAVDPHHTWAALIGLLLLLGLVIADWRVISNTR